MNKLKEAGISWVIIGAQTKPSVMPEREWVKDIVEACDKANIHVFLKDSLQPLCDTLSLYDAGRIPIAEFRDGLLKPRQEMPERLK